MMPILYGLGAGFAIFIGVLLLIAFLRSFLYICKPNEILVFEGRKARMPDGTQRDYTVLDAGRGVRIPLIENVRSMDLSTMTVDMYIANAFSRGNIPLNVHAIANVKICRRPGIIDNALERFLGRNQDEIRQVAKETIEGALRGVLAKLTPEQVNEERATFVQALAHDVEEDLNQLGLTIDTLNIQSVSDSAAYLDKIGRERIANVLLEAEVAESNKKREAEEATATAEASGAVAREQAMANIQRAENALRRERAHLESAARSAEEQTAQAPIEARARAEVQLQEIRTVLERLRLQADEVLPAEARQVASRLQAEGESASILARGEATAEALRLISEAWRDAGDNAEDIFVLEQLEGLLSQVATTIGQVDVKNINLVDGGEGKTLGKLAGAYPAMVASVFDVVASTTGVSLSDVLTRPAKPMAPSTVRRGSPSGAPEPSVGGRFSTERPAVAPLGASPATPAPAVRTAASGFTSTRASGEPSSVPASATVPSTHDND